MITIFLASISPMLMMFCFILIGFFCNKSKITPKNTDIVLSKLETSFFVPALTFNTFMNNCSVKSLSENLRSIILALIISSAYTRYQKKRKSKEKILAELKENAKRNYGDFKDEE